VEEEVVLVDLGVDAVEDAGVEKYLFVTSLKGKNGK